MKKMAVVTAQLIMTMCHAGRLQKVKHVKCWQDFLIFFTVNMLSILSVLFQAKQWVKSTITMISSLGERCSNNTSLVIGKYWRATSLKHSLPIHQIYCGVFGKTPNRPITSAVLHPNLVLRNCCLYKVKNTFEWEKISDHWCKMNMARQLIPVISNEDFQDYLEEYKSSWAINVWDPIVPDTEYIC